MRARTIMAGLIAVIGAALFAASFGAAPASAVPQWVGRVDLGAEKYFTVNLRPGATSADARMVGSYFRRFGLAVDDRSDHVIFVNGTYGQAAAAAGTGFAVAQIGGTRFAHTTAPPRFPRAIALRIVATTLDDGPPMVYGNSLPDISVEPQYGYSAAQLATYYDAASIYAGGNTGQGEKVAVIDCGTYFSQAVAVYEKTNNLPRNTPSVVYVDQSSSGDTSIASFDVEEVIGAAPGTTITEYSIPQNCTAQNFADAYAKIDADMPANHYVAVSVDYSASEDYYDASGLDSVLMAEHADILNLTNAGAQVISDTGLWGAGPSPSQALNAGEITVEYPASDPLVLGVGGTSAIPTSTFTRLFELGWGGSGGGVSHEFAIPRFQKSLPGAASTTNRNVPDVSYDGDENTCADVEAQNPGDPVRQPPYQVCVAGTGTGVNTWTGFVALVDESRVAAGKKPLTNFLNKLYNDTGVFLPIQTGCNDYYCAGLKKYNNLTGLGVPDVAKLVSTLTALP
jgi:subtilase family serine protease